MWVEPCHPRTYLDVIIPGTCKWDLMEIGPWDDQVKVRSSWSRGGPNSITAVLIGREETETQKEVI